MEIERKFLIKDLSKLDLNKFIYKEICQDYLYVDKFTAIRKRKIVQDNITKFFYTVKTGKKGIAINEFENEITKEIYENLHKNPNYNTIQKRRYIITYLNDLVIELDVFYGKYEGIAFAEIEYKDEEQAKTLALPDWFGKEISNTVSNADMAILSKDIILKKLELE